jgi:predicted Zn-ribbon and HTH transcriptional regulator
MCYTPVVTRLGTESDSDRPTTVREAIQELLRHEVLTARDLSRRVGIREHDVAGHLEHVQRSLKHARERLVVRSPRCLACGFEFVERRRYTRPGHCPQCRSRRISLPEFSIVSASRA